MNMILSTIFIHVLLINLTHVNGNGRSQNVWEFIEGFPGTHNCPRCDSVPECYAECDKAHMKEFTNVATWSECKGLCLREGSTYSYAFGNTSHEDPGCAMHSQGKCICVQGDRMACKDIGDGFENCPICGNPYNAGVVKGAPECLYECDWDHMREFTDIASWGECAKYCKSLGDNFDYRFGSAYNDRGCAIYAPYENMEGHGKCVCVDGQHKACENSIWEDAPPAMLPHDDNWEPEAGATSFDMMAGFGVGVISTLIILLIGIYIACTCRKSTYISTKIAAPVKYAKVIHVDDTTDDERVAIIQ